MKVQPTALPNVHLLEPRVFNDECGFFLESFNQDSFCDDLGLDTAFVQDNRPLAD